MRLLFVILLTMGVLPVLATNFVVTSNADSGPNTLRDAILQAAANSTGTGDIIVFNITDRSQAGRTITLLTPLPALTSNLVIDGTTQPGTTFGISNAAVIITNAPAIDGSDYFSMTNVSNIAIYGLWLQSVGANNCFHFNQCTNLQFGGPTKGNLIQGFAKVVYCDLGGSQVSSTGVTVQGNIMGTDPMGTTATPATLNGYDISLRDVANLQIGGLNPGEGNLMVEQSSPMDYSNTNNNDFGFINIEGNTQGTDVTGRVRLSPSHYNFSIDGWDNGSQTPVGNAPVQVNVINNISVGGFAFYEIGGPITVQGNHLGVGSDNVTNLISGAAVGSAALLTFSSCSQALVGGPDPGDINYIAYDTYGLAEYYSGDITISRNSFFCNTTAGISFNWVLSQPAPFINITQNNTSYVGGTAPPNATIELFRADACPGCEGKTYLGTTTADNNGNWRYSQPGGGIVATATDTYGATSPFSTAVIDTKAVVVTDATCGHNNGSIKNIRVVSGITGSWQDASGQIIAGNGTNGDLLNVGPGTYTYFVLAAGGCVAYSPPYTIKAVNLPAFDPASITVTQPGCGQNNGAFQYSGTFDPATTYSWLSAGATVCPDYSAANPLTNLAPGTYTLQLALKEDPTCSAQYGPYTLVNQLGPSLITTKANVVGTTCGNANGSVTGITYQNATQPIYYAWRNAQGATVATTLDLIHATAGQYRFVFKDGGSCDTIFSTYYTIPDQGSITYDTSKMVITPATCNEANGSITGILSNDAETYTWTNTRSGSGNGGSTGSGNSSGTSGAVVGNLEDLTGIDGGTYQLTMTNAIGCQTQTPGFVVMQLGFPAAPKVDPLYILRNTSATIVVKDPQKGEYELFDGPTAGAAILDSSSTGVLHSPNVAQDETLYVGFTNGDCSSPLSPVDIKVFDSLKISIPNAFTPDGDGANRRWHVIVQSPTKKFEVNIYSRWGAMVFHSDDPNVSWDGTVAGHPLTGTFVYMVAGIDYFNRPFLYKGTLMIIR